jgi:hypothetical protein
VLLVWDLNRTCNQNAVSALTFSTDSFVNEQVPEPRAFIFYYFLKYDSRDKEKQSLIILASIEASFLAATNDRPPGISFS